MDPNAVRARLVPAAVAVTLTVLTVACATDPAGDLVFVDRLRNDHPGLSVDDASDAELVELARATCRPEGLDEAGRARLAALGIDHDDFVAGAARFCPSR